VEGQLNGFDASRYPVKFAPEATVEDKILAIVEWLNREIRYTGVEFSEASLVPRKPSEVLQRKYGDCKDKSTLAVALLRAAGIDAHVALLYSSAGLDIEPELPGIDAFNHAIVYVPGQPDLWLDPTDPDLRLHVVSPENQGRYALIARPQTTALMRTPELTAKDNRAVETREFTLSELGRAKVVETTEAYGTLDREFRGEFTGLDQKKLRENFKDYVDWTYAEAKISAIAASDTADLARPLQLKIEIEDAQRGTTARTEAVVGIRLQQIAVRLPDYFRQEPDTKKKDDSKPAPAPRTQDFAIAEPFTEEWHYVIAAPPGFRTRQLPESLDEKLGPATLTARFTAQGDRTVLGDFQFAMPKRRFTAAEGAALRDAVLELEKRKMTLVYFDQIGETALASGDVKTALAEFAALRKLHPNEALHAMQTARALLTAGVGDAARAEARRAVALEPASAKAYVQLAEVLEHDLVGRSMQKGFDAAGAAAAFRKALELDPADNETRGNLAILLEHNQAGVRYGPGAKLDDALGEYKKILDKLPALGLPANYAIALLRAGRYRELKDYLAKQPDNETNQTLRVCAEAMLNGAKAGIQQAGEVSGVEARQKILGSAAQTLMILRQYELAAALFEAAATGHSAPAALATLIQTLHKTKRVEDMPQTIKEPEDAVRLMAARVLLIERHEGDLAELLSPYSLIEAGPDVAKTVALGLMSARAKVRTTGLPFEVAIDLGLSAAQFSREGSDETGWVIRMAVMGQGSGDAASGQTWFVTREDGTYRILAAPGDYTGVARLALKLLEQGQVERARIWLDRVRQELPAGGGDDPLSGHMFSRVWQQGQTSGAESIRLGAALLLSGSSKGTGDTIAMLEDAAKTAGAEAANPITASLAEAYFAAKQYGKALAAGEALLAKLPLSPTALSLALRAAYASGGQKDADRIAAANLDRFKNNVTAQRMAAGAALGFGDTARAIAISRQILDSGRGVANDCNRIAWAELMAGKVTAVTLETANRGMMLSNNQDMALMHTLAAVDAELDKEADARTALLQRMDVEGHDEPDDNEWYVFGRIAEQYGLTQEAAAMYRRLAKPENELAIPASSYALAQKRLKAMGRIQ
jgi:tetratricopeptide (TPR) repeat protein